MFKSLDAEAFTELFLLMVFSIVRAFYEFFNISKLPVGKVVVILICRT